MDVISVRPIFWLFLASNCAGILSVVIARNYSYRKRNEVKIVKVLVLVIVLDYSLIQGLIDRN